MPDDQPTMSPDPLAARCDSGSRVLTREELYALVWETPLSRLSKQFGLSDVGLRKICVKHNIPTPPLGWWAKRAHGKAVRKKPLPPSESMYDSRFRIVMRDGPEAPPEIAAAQDAAVAQEFARATIAVPSERPAKLHPVATATSKTLHAAKADGEGFKHANDEEGVNATVSVTCVNRVICIVDAFVRALTERGFLVSKERGGIRAVVDEVPYEWRMYEIKDQTSHIPTLNELKEQARRDEWRTRHPPIYSSASKAYRSFDSVPSGRLAMVFLDATMSSWRVDDRVIGRWRDTSKQRLEDRLNEAMTALVSSAVTIKHRLAEEAEKERLRQKELERQRRLRARIERERLRQDFVLKKSDEFARFERLSRLLEHLKRRASSWKNDQPVDWIVGELKELVELLGRRLERETLNEEIIGLKLYTEDDRPVEEAEDD
jgi:hypothetical protein